MRFIGNKEKLLDNIYHVIEKYTDVKSGVFCDFFSGTANVGRYFKDKGFKIISSDILYFSYILQKAYIENNTEPEFTKLLKKVPISQNTIPISSFNTVREYLNSLNGQKGFIYKNYTEDGTKGGEHIRKYFLSENGMKIDAIRSKIEQWHEEDLISEGEYYLLLASLIESVPFYANISGVYAAFLKKYDPRALKKLEIKPIKIYKSKKNHEVYNEDSLNLLSKLEADILYIDPPYNNRQYGANYHLLETIARYDNPEIRGLTGMRDYYDQKSDFCNKNTALSSLEKIATEAKYKYLLLSYNSEGIMSKDEIKKVLRRHGNVRLLEFNYLRFKSNSNGDSKHKKLIKEHLYLLKK